MNDRIEITYRRERGSLSTTDIASEVNRLWADLARNEELRAAARQKGFDPDELTRELSTAPIEVKAEGADFDPVTITIVVAGYVARDLWKKLVLPRIVAKYGVNAVGEETDERGPGADGSG